MFNYLREVRAELRHVNWPSRQQTILYSVVVIVVTILVSSYLGILDYGFSAVIQHIL